MNAEDRREIALRTLERSRADQTEVRVSACDRGLMRFTRGISNQNLLSSDVEITVRAIVDGRTGVATANDLSDASIEALANRAREMATFAPRNEMLPPLQRSVPERAPPGCWVEATAKAQPAARAAICDALMSRAEGAGNWCAGFVSTDSDGITIVNSAGTLASFDGTDSQANVKVTALDSTGFAEQYSTDVRAIDADAIGCRAAEKAMTGAHPLPVEPGEWTVILEPPAFGELFAYLVAHFSAQNFSDGSSFCSDGLDRSYFDERVTVVDDYAHPLAPSMPFDYEGYPKSRVALVENGVVRNIVTDSYYARKLDRPNTGHALPAPSAVGPQPLNIAIAPGQASTPELISRTKRGLLISRFWYIRTVDQKRAIVTGMTRDGTFLIESGRITRGVRNMRFNQSILHALQNVEFSDVAQRSAQYSYSLVVPAAKIERFAFTSATEF
jgi:PmbA protein